MISDVKEAEKAVDEEDNLDVADLQKMAKEELVIQLAKIALGVLIAGYFFWWSLEVLKRLPPPH